MAQDTTTGVFPCYKNQFAIGATGEASPTTAIANMEEYSVSFNNGIEEWTAYGSEGWKSRLPTAKDIVISVKGKRTIGDSGYDMVAGFAFKNGREAMCNFLWTFPDGATVLFTNAVISVTALNAAASTGVAPLEFDIQSNGKVVYTPAA